MILTFINWIYIGVTAFLMGWAAIKGIEKVLIWAKLTEHPYSVNVFDCVFGGIVVATLYAEIFSFFGGVSLVANILMIGACIVIVILGRKDISIVLSDFFKKINIVFILLSTAVFVLCLIYTAQSTFHYDTGLYHAQAIHWLEDYGLIKGLGRIHVRFAYNSAYFPVCALYSFKAVCGQSLHSVSGFLFLLICLYCLYGWLTSIRNKTFLRSSAVSDMVRMAPFFYLLCCLIEITSPESDYVTVIFFIWIVLRFIEICERDSECLIGYIFVTLVAFMVVSYKMSAAPVVLVALRPIYMLIKKKNYKCIFVCAGIAVLILLPWFVRNYFICGWLIYPVSFIDLFNPVWKFSKEMVAGDAGEIGAWAMESQDGSVMGAGWIQFWWSKQNEATQLFVYSIIVSVPLMILTFIKEIVALFVPKMNAEIDKREKERRISILYIEVLLIVTLVFYMLTAPLIRYCYGPVLMLPLIVAGFFLSVACQLKRGKVLGSLVAGGCALIIILPSIKSCKALIKFDYEETLGRFEFEETLIKQIDYPKPDVYAMDWCGMKVYLPNEGDQCWYDAFPSSPYIEGFKYTTLIGDELSEGVMPIQ